MSTSIRLFLNFVCCCFVSLFVATCYADTKAHLVLNAGGHTANVRKVLWMADGERVLTVGEDNAVFLWNTSTGIAQETIRFPMGDEKLGTLFAGAISPDGQFLAVGGVGPRDKEFPIYVFSLAIGEIEERFVGHNNAINHLAFSPDGKRLASGSSDMSARVWNLETRKCDAIFRGHAGSVNCVSFSPDRSTLATAADDHTSILWSLITGDPKVSLLGHTAAATTITFRPDGRRIATGSDDGTVRFWDATGNRLNTIRLGKRSIVDVTFSPNGESLLYTQGPGEGPRLCGVIDAKTGRTTADFSRHTNTVFAGAFSPDGRAVATCGGSDQEIWIWKPTNGEPLQRLSGQGTVAWSAAWGVNMPVIAWGNTSHAIGNNAEEPLERAFHLGKLSHQVLKRAAGENIQYRHAQSTVGRTRVSQVDGPTLAVLRGDRTNQLTFAHELAGNVVNTIRSFSLWDESHVAVGSDFGLYLFDATGAQVRRFRGDATIWAVSPSPDGRFLLASANDMTLRIYRKDDDTPLLSMFFAGNEWIVWTEPGYYAASPGGELLMGWQVDRGADLRAEFHPAASFRKSFFRPDVILRVLEMGSVERAIVAAAEASEVVDHILPPDVKIVSPSVPHFRSETRVMEITAVGVSRNSDYPITSMRLLLDGRPYEGQCGQKSIEREGTSRQTWSISLPDGTHDWSVKTETAASTNVSKAVTIEYKNARHRGSLWLLGVGISKYENETVTPLKHADGDCQKIVAAFKNYSVPLFDKVSDQALINEQADRATILDALDDLRKNVKAGDTTVVFYSGHGVTDLDDTFFFATSDIDPKRIAATGLSAVEVKRMLANMAGRIVLILDACHAGAADERRFTPRPPNTDALAGDLATSDYGVMVIASSMGDELSRESDGLEQGIFTHALLEGLSGSADADHDGEVFTHELEGYLYRRVRQLSGNLQHPTIAKPGSIRTFALTRPDKNK